MEELVLALGSRDIDAGLLITQEITLGNYIKSVGRGINPLNYRKHADIRFVENLTIHLTPLRWERDPIAKRRQNILRKAEVKFRAYMRKFGIPDLIFHHGIFDYTYITRFLSERFQIPYWFKEHSSYINPERFPCANDFENPESLKDFVQKASRRFAASGFYAEKMKAVFSAPFEVLHNALTDQHFNHEPILRATDTFVFLNVAIMVPIKNQQLIVRAFAQAFDNDPCPCKLIIAGDGNLHDTLEGLCDQLGITENVRILKFQNREGIKNLFSQSHAFVLASDLETFGVVLIEAMGYGLPVISSRIPGPMELVNEQNGIFFNPGDVNDLAKAMRSIYDQYDRFDQDAIKKEIRAHFGPDSVIAVLLNHPLFAS